jgi:hypothetical protein
VTVSTLIVALYVGIAILVFTTSERAERSGAHCRDGVEERDDTRVGVEGAMVTSPSPSGRAASVVESHPVFP